MKILVNYARSRGVNFYYGDKMIPVSVQGTTTAPFYRYSITQKDINKYYEELDSLRKLTETKLFKDLYQEPNNSEEITKLINMKYPYKKFKQFEVFDSPFTSELVYKRTNFDRSLKVHAIHFEERDNDIKNALLFNRISPILANAIICGRNHSEEIVNDNGFKITKVNLYRHYRIPKKKAGEFRDIYEPIDEFKLIMKDLNRILQSYFNTKQKRDTTNQFAYIENRSIVDNAKIHRDNKTIVKVDIHKFFESIQFKYIERYLKYLCKDYSLLNEFSKYITDPNTGGLYMGNPISGTLANILMYKVSKSLESIFHKKGMEVSIYSDDITVSSNNKISKEMVVSIIEYVFNKFNLNDLSVKPEKTRKLKKQNRVICGVTINGDDKLTVRRNNYEMTRVMLHKLSKGEKITIPESTLIGRINFYRYVDETGKFERLLNKYSDVLKNIGYDVNKEENELVLN